MCGGGSDVEEEERPFACRSILGTSFYSRLFNILPISVSL